MGKGIKHDREDFFQVLLKGDRLKGSEIAKKYSESTDEIKVLYEQVIKPSLYQIGELWENNLISVAAEHLATSIAESIMNELYYDLISETRVEKKVLLACVENEHHQVGVKMVADVFEMNGWDTHFLGANVPTKELLRYAKDIVPNLFAISISIYFHIDTLDKMIGDITDLFPNTPLVIGGQALRKGHFEFLERYNNIQVLKNLSDIQHYIDSQN